MPAAPAVSDLAGAGPPKADTLVAMEAIALEAASLLSASEWSRKAACHPGTGALITLFPLVVTPQGK